MSFFPKKFPKLPIYFSLTYQPSHFKPNFNHKTNLVVASTPRFILLLCIKLLLGFYLLLLSFTKAITQTCPIQNIQEISQIASTCNAMVLTMEHDQLDRPYLYVANKEAGLKIYDLSNLNSPTLVSMVPISQLEDLHVMNLTQQGSYLYLALGNHFTNPQQAGMAVIDVGEPGSPELTDYFILPNSASGAGIVQVEGEFAYLGAMKSGLVVFDITHKNDIQFVSQFIPDINYPVNDPNPSLYNARGMAVKDDIVYLCYDAGGLRILNCQDKTRPIETGRYANPALHEPFNLPRAYNNIILDDSLVYIAVDYCGVEVLNISDTSRISMTGWWNPEDCPQNNWFTSPVHTNELYFDKKCRRLFTSTGKSDMMVLDLTDPAQPKECGSFGNTEDQLGTWGVGGYQKQLYLSYICAIIPFSGNWTGVKILSYTPCAVTAVEEAVAISWSVFPNPATDQLNIQSKTFLKDAELIIFNPLGQTVQHYSGLTGTEWLFDITTFERGIYYFRLVWQKNHTTFTLAIEP